MDVVARLSAVLPRGSWGFNSYDGREWVGAYADIDRSAIVDDVLASRSESKLDPLEQLVASFTSVGLVVEWRS